MLWEISILTTKGRLLWEPLAQTPLLLTPPGRERRNGWERAWGRWGPPAPQHSSSCVKQEGPFPQKRIKPLSPKIANEGLLSSHFPCKRSGCSGVFSSLIPRNTAAAWEPGCSAPPPPPGTPSPAALRLISVSLTLPGIQMRPQAPPIPEPPPPLTGPRRPDSCPLWISSRFSGGGGPKAQPSWGGQPGRSVCARSPAL